jgi:hypothetical protein
MLRLLVPCLIAPVLISTPAQARDLIGMFQTWGAFQSRTPTRVCYAISVPTQATRARRSEPYLTVAFYPGRNDAQVMVSAGAPLRSARASVGGQSFTLRAQGEAAWMANSAGDADVIAALQSGRQVSVRTTSTRGTALVDTYALTGFAQAWAAARKACG